MKALLYPGNTGTKTRIHHTDLTRLLSDSAVSIGYLEGFGAMLGTSAWQLCNRGLDGAEYSLRFLKAMREVAVEERAPRHGRSAFELPCPLFASAVFLDAMSHAEKDLGSATTNDAIGAGLKFLGIAAPLLMLPILSHTARNAPSRYHGAQIDFADCSVFMSDDFIIVEGAELDTVTQQEFTRGFDVTARFVRDARPDKGGWVFPKERHEEIWIPDACLKKNSVDLDRVEDDPAPRRGN
jgi:hypothetical protein